MDTITIKEGQIHLPSRDLYHYEAFRDAASIRVLTLFPSKDPSSEIHISLSIARLIDDPEYDALSYTWQTRHGDASLSSSIICDGCLIKVTRNCEDALRKLRRQEFERVLWIDAICIDQNNIEERGCQVALMGAIYRQATQALIWLGDGSETIDPETGLSVSALFFKYLAPMGAELEKSRSAGDYPLSSALYNALSCQAADHVTSGTHTPLTQGFLDVVLRPWWERVWVVQEAALAKSATVICGEETANYLDFYTLYFQILVDSRHESGLTHSLLEGYKHHMYSVMQVKELVQDLGPAKALHAVLSRCRRLRATDKRDHIFAVLDLFGDFKSKLPSPDYNKSMPEILSDITQRFLGLFESLYILHESTNVESDLAIPSWVTDWSQKPQFHIQPTNGLYHASRDSKPCCSISDGGKGLQLLGKLVDVLDRMPKADIAAYRNPYVPAKAILGYQESCRVGLSIDKYPTGENVREVLWRTLCWNVDVHAHYPAEKELGKHFDKFHGALISGKDIKAIEMDLLHEAAEFNDICVHSMPLCITAKGYLASVPWTAKEGDRIAILAGGEVPFVLRKDAIGGHYRLMGACYVHGIMDGEAFPPNSSELESISIR